MLAVLVEIFLSSIHSSFALFFVPIHVISLMITGLCSGDSPVSKGQFFVEVVMVLLPFPLSTSALPWLMLFGDKLKYTPPVIMTKREMPMRIERLVNMLIKVYKVRKFIKSVKCMQALLKTSFLGSKVNEKIILLLNFYRVGRSRLCFNFNILEKTGQVFYAQFFMHKLLFSGAFRCSTIRTWMDQPFSSYIILVMLSIRFLWWP